METINFDRNWSEIVDQKAFENPLVLKQCHHMFCHQTQQKPDKEQKKKQSSLAQRYHQVARLSNLNI